MAGHASLLALAERARPDDKVEAAGADRIDHPREGHWVVRTVAVHEKMMSASSAACAPAWQARP
jgi:hypothetical protein